MVFMCSALRCRVLCCAVQIGVDLGTAGCIRDIAKGTADIKVQVVFCNAGYIMKGFFYARCVCGRADVAVCTAYEFKSGRHACSPSGLMESMLPFCSCMCANGTLPTCASPTQLVPDADVVLALLVLSAVCRTAEEVRKNIECNALSAVDVTHHFLKRMVSGQHTLAG